MHHTRRSIVVLVAVLALLAAVPQLATAKSQVSFKAEIHEGGVGLPPPYLCGPALVCIPIGGTGHATHLGQTREVGLIMVDVSNPDCRANTRTETLTGANGDQLTLATQGISCRTGAASGVTNISHDTWVVTGGTGRFSGATGSGAATVYIYDFGVRSRNVLTGAVSSPGSH